MFGFKSTASVAGIGICIDPAVEGEGFGNRCFCLGVSPCG